MKTRARFQKTKNTAVFLLAIVMCISLFVGCGDSKTGDVKEGSTHLGTVKPEAATTSEMQEEATIRWYFKMSKNPQVTEDDFVIKKIKEDLNINFVHMAPKTDDFNETLNLLLAAGDIPDVITISSSTGLTSRLSADGVIIPIEQYLSDEYIPNVIRITPQWDAVIKYMKHPDEHIYGVPVTRKHPHDVSMYIRHDWLKNLNLSVPTNLEELRNVLEKFTKNDPDGNNKNDTVGTMIDGLWAPTFYQKIMACDKDEWYLSEDGTVTNGSVLPRHKDFLKYMKSLIDTGGLDKETLTTNYNALTEKVNSGKVGFVFTWSGYNQRLDIQKVVPESDWGPMPAVKGAFDIGVLPGNAPLSSEHVITKDCKNVDAVLRLMNYMADDKSTEDKYDFTGSYWYMTYGKKGLNWDVVDGKFVTGDNNPEMYKQNNEIDKWVYYFNRFANMFDNAIDDALEPEPKKFKEEFYSSPLISTDISDENPLKFINIGGIVLPEEVTNFRSAQGPKWEELYGKAILGKGDIDKMWDEYIKVLENDGLQQIEDTMTKLCREYGRIK